MANTALNRVMEAVARSMSAANTTLIKEQQARPGIGYVVSELEISVPIVRLSLGDGDDVNVDLNEDDQDRAGQYVRFKIQPLPDALTQVAAGTVRPGVPDIKDHGLAEGLMALAESGYNLNRVLIAYDAASDAPAGRVLRTEVRGDGLRRAEQDVIVTIAGRAPDDRGDDRDLPDDLLNIEGIGEKYAERLVAAGIRNTTQLAKRAGTAAGRNSLAEETEISPKLLERWVIMIGLIRISGIGPEFAELLEAAGVRSVKMLAKQEPARLHARLSEVNEKTPKVRRLPSKKRLAEWIEAAGKTGAG